MSTRKEIFEVKLGAARTSIGSSPFLRDKWHGVLKLDVWLKEEFQPGDKVSVTVERVEK